MFTDITRASPLRRFAPRPLLIASAGLALLTACNHKVTGPAPKVSGVTPPAVCTQQITTPVTISGDEFSPLPVKTLTDTPQVVLPAVNLSRTQDIDGGAVSDAAVTIPDNPAAPADSHVRWNSQKSLEFDVFPDLGLATGLYSIDVKNANGNKANLPNSLLAVPPPTLNRIDPDILCGDDDNSLTLSGDFFIRFGNLLPTVSFGSAATLDATSLSDCRTLPGTSGAEACKSLTVDIPAQTLSAGGATFANFDVVVHNPGSVPCASTESVVLTIVPRPTLASIVPDLMCVDQADHGVTLNGTGFITIDGATPQLGLNDTTFDTTAVAATCTPVTGPREAVQSCTQLTATIPQSSLSPGTYATVVTNPPPVDCFTEQTINFQVVPPPVINSVQPDLVCVAQGARSITIRGSGFLTVDDGSGAVLPTVDVAGLNPTPSPSDCTPVPGPLETLQSCNTLTISIPATVAAGGYDVAVTNPAPADCTTMPPGSLYVVQPPTLASVQPQAICLANGDTPLVATGSDFLIIDGQLPTLTLSSGSDVRTYTPATSGDVGGCVDVSGPTESVQSCTSFTVTATQDLSATAVTTYDAVATNPDPAGCASSEPVTVSSYPPPVVTSPTTSAPITICQGGGSIAITGTNLRDAALVRIGGVGSGTTTPTNCTADGLCTGLTAQFSFLPDSLVTSSPVDLVVENGSGCDATVSQAVNVTSGPLALYADPPTIYDGIDNQLTVYATNFTTPSIDHVDLVPQNGDPPIVLCDASGTPTSCNSLSGATSGAFAVRVPSGLLPTLTGSPTDATFDLQVMETGVSACPAQLVNAVHILSVPDEQDTNTLPDLVTVTPASGMAGTDTAVNMTLSSDPSVSVLFSATPRVFMTSASSGGPLKAVAFVNDHSLSAVVPSSFTITGAYEDFDLIIITPDGKLIIQHSAFRLSSFAPPRIDTISPGQVPSSGATVVSVLGSGFENDSGGATSVALTDCHDSAGNPPTVTPPTPTNVTVGSATGLTFDIGAGGGSYACNVQVTNPQDGTSDTYAALVFAADTSGNIPQTTTSQAALNTGREGLGVAVAGATRAARYLYAAGGDTGDFGSTLDTVEYAHIDINGNLGSFATARYKLNIPRSHFGLLKVGRALYAVGGAVAPTGTAPYDVTSSVERAVVLDPSQVVSPSISGFTLGTAASPGMAKGGWIYRVAIVYAANDPINPCGESLPSEPFVFVIPDVTNGLKITLSWNQPDTTTAGTIWSGRSIAGYRIYRTALPDQGLGDIAFLNDVDGASSTSYSDDGQTIATRGSITGCSGTPPMQQPLAEGETSKWVDVPALALNQGRMGAGFQAVPDRSGTSRVFLYALSGMGTTGAPPDTVVGLDDYEYVAINYDPTTNPIAWESGLSWTDVPTSIPTGTTSCMGSGARADAGLFLYNADNSSIDGTTYQIPGVNAAATDQFLLFGPGRRDTGTAVGLFQSWRIDQSTGVLDATAARNQCLASVATASYGNIGANQQLFTFGGSASPSAVRAVDWTINTSDALTIGSSYNDNGTQLTIPRQLHGTVLNRAFIYIVGGLTTDPNSGAAVVTNSVESGIW